MSGGCPLSILVSRSIRYIIRIGSKYAEKSVCERARPSYKRCCSINVRLYRQRVSSSPLSLCPWRGLRGRRLPLNLLAAETAAGDKGSTTRLLPVREAQKSEAPPQVPFRRGGRWPPYPSLRRSLVALLTSSYRTVTFPVPRPSRSGSAGQRPTRLSQTGAPRAARRTYV